MARTATRRRPAEPRGSAATAEVVTNPAEVIVIPAGINSGLSSAKRSTMISILGLPRDTFDSTCRGATNEPTKSLLTTQDVGPFRVTGIRPAVESLRDVLGEVRVHQPIVYQSLGTAGMFCARLIGGSTNPSNHSWGCAVDVSISGTLDGLGITGHDGRTLAGLAAMAPFFHKAGWYWGVGFSSFEDGMHFEVADETIRQWHADGRLGAAASGRSVPDTNLSIGDRGREVAQLQQALAARGFDIIADGNFGPITHSIVMAFQASQGLVPDGVAGARTKAALGL